MGASNYRCLHTYIAILGTLKNFTLLVFCLQVKQKTQEMKIKRNDAILEVYTDRIFRSRPQAILYVSKQDISEFFVCNYYSTYIAQSVITTHIYMHAYLHG